MSLGTRQQTPSTWRLRHCKSTWPASHPEPPLREPTQRNGTKCLDPGVIAARKCLAKLTLFIEEPCRRLDLLCDALVSVKVYLVDRLSIQTAFSSRR